MDLFITTGIATALIIVSGWCFIYLFWSHLFYASPLEKETDGEQNAREIGEEEILRRDLEEEKDDRGVNILTLVHARDVLKDPIKYETLVNIGIAENRTLSLADANEKNALPGDHWMCDGRPIWFGLIQLALAWPAAFACSAFLNPVGAALLAVPIITAIIGFLAYDLVPENTRLGVSRWGKQCTGYLRPGLNFILFPWLGIEESELVPLFEFVWGPEDPKPADKDKKDEEKEDSTQLGGALGTPANPAPGKFEVTLHGRWAVVIELAITIRVRRSTKMAWYYWLNEYASMTEIGKMIGAAASAVLTTRAREVELRHHNGKKDDKAEKNFEQKKALTDADLIMAANTLIDFLNQLPEISGIILLTLQELGRDRLGGILPVSVALAAVRPSIEFQQLFQGLDKTNVSRLSERMTGEAVVNRLKLFQDFVGKGNPADVLELERLYTQRKFAEGASGVDTIVKAFGLLKTQESVKK